MTIEDALALIDTALDPSCFKNLHQDIFRLSWQGKSYQEIAETCGYDTDYVRHVGYQLWQNLSQALAQKVTKRNLQVVFRRLEQQSRILSNDVKEIASLVLTPQYAKSNINAYPTKVELVSDQTIYPLLWSDSPNRLYPNHSQLFVGRQQEQQTLCQWLTRSGQDQTRPVQLISLLGMAGIGKTSLVQKVIHQVQDRFQRIIWCSLRNAPTFTETFANIVNTDEQATSQWPTSIDAQIEILMHYFLQHRCLLVLDNFETILQPGQMGGSYRLNHQAYGQLLRHMMDSPHQSCVLLTSREQPVGVNLRNQPTVQTLYLQGLSLSETYTLLNHQEVEATQTDAETLYAYYGGNPYALKVAATNVTSLFHCQVAEWIKQGNFVFGTIQQLLKQQLQRLAPTEQQIVNFIASETGSITLDQLHEALVLKDLVSTTDLLPALQSLQSRSLLCNQEDGFRLLPYLREYVCGYQTPVGANNRASTPAVLTSFQPATLTFSTALPLAHR
ncbi:NACHT domain-containing protein [Acaryochloris sp. 'Moss Beach']|uniref:NB-ARC domain-containing protein n=1 Tax=Acaryochloris sp. 'Moss Beach' TaxID=2740837 RepID=UPI001F262417|nr:NB-ARC domain-containing protein [Acaryochloris sp. 'Moss Beach']UJB71725.1 NACHT domain-containing protein [Acaryochloris sp. 'Moss Beach']